MTAVLKIVDQCVGRDERTGFTLRLASERVTCRQLIERRVRDELQIAAARLASAQAQRDRSRSFLIRFDASAVEAALNAPRSRSAPPPALDEAQEIGQAIEGFEKNRYVMLFDDRQIEDLDEELTVTPDSEVVFLRLVPLIGG